RERFEETLRRLEQDRLVPRQAADVFHSLRKLGNTAAHENAGSHTQALSALKLAWQLGVWYHRTYGRTPKFRAEAFVPPPEPSDPSAALHVEIAELRQKLADSESATARAQREASERTRAQEDLAARLVREVEDRATWEALAAEAETKRVEVEA